MDKSEFDKLIETVGKIDRNTKSFNQKLTKLSGSIGQLTGIRKSMTIMIRAMLLLTGIILGFAAGVAVEHYREKPIPVITSPIEKKSKAVIPSKKNKPRIIKKLSQ